MTKTTDNVELGKEMSAKLAVELIEDGMIVGLGTGSTAKIAIDLLGQRVAQGLRIKAVATSKASFDQGLKLGIDVLDINDVAEVDVTIDGADRVDRSTRTLIKGLGGALLREKIVASISHSLIIIVDERKITDKLGVDCPIPVEVTQFGYVTTKAKLRDLGGEPVLRRTANEAPFVTDGGNYILDCQFGLIKDPAGMEASINQVIGVIESGLFVGMDPRVIVGTATTAFEL
ncbi:MAG: ribose-5-phosphate isomerase RpiA [Cyanobacteria bacterium REEB67]|nr:ribose-5-phosphate isomerase RpiA [Cyanobacteria bacterium REEB67]